MATANTTDAAPVPPSARGAIANARPLPILILFTANAISLIGNVLAMVAIPWFVLQTTGSATQMGITGFFTVLPVAVAAFLGGGLVDRLGYKRASIIADVTSGIAIALIPLLFYTAGLAFWQLLVLVFIGNLLDAPGNTARSALIPELAQLANMPLERASAAIQAIERGSRLVGAPLAGVLIAILNPGNVLWIDAATFIASALLVALAVPWMARVGNPAPRTYAAELFDGLKFLRKDRLIKALVLTVMITNFLDAPSGTVVLPVYAKQQSGSAVDLGLMIAALGGGALLGAVLFGVVGHRLPRRVTFAFMYMLVGMRFFALALFPDLPVVLLVMFIAGVAAGPLNPIMSTIEYERIPPDMRGRVFGTITAGAWFAMPLGTLLGGFAVERMGLLATLLTLGILYLLTTSSLLVNPSIREMDRATTADAH